MTEENRQHLDSKGSDNLHIIHTVVNRKKQLASERKQGGIWEKSSTPFSGCHLVLIS